jgi:WD repeat-containing protein 35
MDSRENAKEYYQKAGNTERLIQCYQQLEDYAALEKMVAELPEKHPLLPRIAEIFVTMGMCQEAVSTYVKVNTTMDLNSGTGS